MGASRAELLRALVRLERPVEELERELSAFGWDCERELVGLARSDIAAVLRRWRAGELPAESVRAWAEALEIREDVGLEAAAADAVEGVIFWLANPEINGPLTVERVEALLKEWDA